MDHSITSEKLFQMQHIPLDKSWLIRMGVLDLLYGEPDTSLNFLRKQQHLSDDLSVLIGVLESWNRSTTIDVGESGTLYRILQFASWKLKLNKKFIRRGTLVGRNLTMDSAIVDYPIKRLLKLDHETSQWATAAVLLGNHEAIPTPPYKLRLTYRALVHWRQSREAGKPWEPRYDRTILKQATAFIRLRSGLELNFMPRQSEDYCFARAFGVMTKYEGERRWPNLRGHESNRLNEMEIVLNQLKESRTVTSSDHRVVQTVSMLANIQNKPCRLNNRQAVNKSWPEFWEFMHLFNDAAT